MLYCQNSSILRNNWKLSNDDMRKWSSFNPLTHFLVFLFIFSHQSNKFNAIQSLKNLGINAQLISSTTHFSASLNKVLMIFLYIIVIISDEIYENKSNKLNRYSNKFTNLYFNYRVVTNLYFNYRVVTNLYFNYKVVADFCLSHTLSKNVSFNTSWNWGLIYCRKQFPNFFLFPKFIVLNFYQLFIVFLVDALSGIQV